MTAPHIKTFQQRVAPWMQACFGPEISADKLERGDRFLEEALELLQSGGYPSDRVAALTRYVFNREAGEPAQEVGGVMVTLAAYCLAHDLDMHEAGETELARIWTKVEKIRAKHAAKPKGSALPIPVADLPPTDAEVMAHPTVKALVDLVNYLLVQVKAANANLSEAVKALEVYAEPCDGNGHEPCGYEGNMCCKTANETLSLIRGKIE
ncbi:MAG: hypothetical protein LPK02_07480 [Rhodobacterales bacterium]|nr:hypothetical protein [Rhodobacterales bacterium]